MQTMSSGTPEEGPPGRPWEVAFGAMFYTPKKQTRAPLLTVESPAIS